MCIWKLCILANASVVSDLRVHIRICCAGQVAKLYQHHVWLSLTRGYKCQTFAPKIVMISYERLHVGLQVLSADNFMEKWSLTLVKKISSSRRIRESCQHCCAPPGEGSVGCPTPQQGIGAAQGKAPRSKTDWKFSSLCPSTCWFHSFVYNNNVYYFTVGFFIVVTDHFFRCIALSHMRNSNLSG